MKIKILLAIMSDEDEPERVEEVVQWERGELQNNEALGLSLTEAKALLASLQQRVIESQAETFVAAHASCPKCCQVLRRNGSHDIVLRTVFGKVKLKSPRFYYCHCEGGPRKSFSPLAAAVPERTSAELLYLETKWAALMSYGLTQKLLQEVLPVSHDLNATAIQQNVKRLGERMEGELGEEKEVYLNGCGREWEQLPEPAGPLVVGIDGGYVRACQPKAKGTGGSFEVIVGKSIPTEGPAKCFGFVQRYDQKPKRRLFELLSSQGLQMNQEVTFLSDGGESVRNLPMYLSPQATYLLDWFHITMRLTVLEQMRKGLAAEAPPAVESSSAQEGEEQLHTDEMAKWLESLKWNLWHGNVHRALQLIEELEGELEGQVERSEKARKLQKAVRELQSYLTANREFIPNYGDRWRNQERISTGFAESAVNQVIAKRFVKKQQMRWSERGAHLLLQIRTRVLNEEWQGTMARWYPGSKLQAEAVLA
jgi:hypothetical protein